jgi:hypothetical protein
MARINSHKELVKGRKYIRIDNKEHYFKFRHIKEGSVTFSGSNEHDSRPYTYKISEFDERLKEVVIIEEPTSRFERELKELLDV